MQLKVHQFVEEHTKHLDNPKTLDVGSFDVNGSLKDLFEDYTGLDMRDGPNVDVVANGHKLPFKGGTFDLVTSVETFEHDDDPFRTMHEIHRVLKPGGLAVIAASGINFPKHDYPSDYFRYTSEGMAVLLKKFNNIYTTSDDNEAYGVGTK